MTLLLVVASWQYSYLVEVDPGVSNALSCFKSRHVRITSWGAVNVYAHVTSREHREDKRTTRPDTYIYTNIPRDVGRTSPSMWGSLRLAPIIILCGILTYFIHVHVHCKLKINNDLNKIISTLCRICYWECYCYEVACFSITFSLDSLLCR